MEVASPCRKRPAPTELASPARKSLLEVSSPARRRISGSPCRTSADSGQAATSTHSLQARDDMGSPVKKCYNALVPSLTEQSESTQKKGPECAESQCKEPCAICLDEHVKEVLSRAKPCGHLFCLDCIKRWTDQSKKCPLCKQDMLAVLAPRDGQASSLLLQPPSCFSELAESDDEDSDDPDQIETELPWIRGQRTIEVLVPSSEVRGREGAGAPASRESRRLHQRHTC